jgi:hypothetical protein
MASNKPAKRNISNSSPSVPKVDEGAKVLYVGATKSVFHSCPECSSKRRKGMVIDYKGSLYCSRNCVRSVKRVEANA